jgi:hypothetical protein
MLPEDSKQRKDNAGSSQQTSLADHFQQNDAQVIPYSAKAFEVSAIEWLVHTNQVGPRYFHSQIDLTLGCQPIQAFNHPSFKTMLDMASRATKVQNCARIPEGPDRAGAPGEDSRAASDPKL